MNKFLSVPKNSQYSFRGGQTGSFQSKHSETTSIMRDTFNASHYLKTQQSKQNKWLGSLHQKPLLQIIADSVQINQFTPVNSTELNCYERLKKLLVMQTGKKRQDRQPQQNVEILNNVVILQNQINKLQQKYRDNENMKIKLNKPAKSAIRSKKNSFFQRTSPNSSLNTTQKSFHLTQNYKLKKRAYSPVKSNEDIKQTIKSEIAELKNVCIEKFVAHKKKLNEQIFEQVQDFINNTLQRKLEDLINCKMKNTYIAQEENKKCKLILLEKDLQIQSLKKQLKNKEEKIVNNIKMQQPQQQMINYRRNVQQFYEEYQIIFGSIKLPELKKKVDFLENIYINKYAQEESKHLQRLNKAEQEKRQIVKKMNEKLQEYEVRENQMRDMINKRRKYEQLDNSQETHEIYNRINWYRAKSNQLQQLQKFIFNKYTQWINTKSQAQNKVIQLLNNDKLQSYTQMILAMLEFQKGFGDQHKHIQFISKLCNAVAKIKKIMAPNSIYKKLEPLKSVQQIQVYLLNLKPKQKKLKTINKAKKYLNDQQM